MTYDLGYAKGCVYKIICKTDCEIVYIGSTFNKPSKRWNEHKNGYNNWIKDPTKKCYSIYPYFKSIGIENFKLLKIKDYEVYRADRLDRKHLLVYEQLWINKTKCVNKNSAFSLWKLFEKEQAKIYREKNKDRLNEKKKIYNEKNKEHISEWKKLYRENNKELLQEKKKIYYQNNKELKKEKGKIYYQDNKELKKEQAKIYREKNKEQIREQKKIYNEKNKEQISERHKLYHENNKEQIKEQKKKHYQDTKVICPICLKEFGKYYLKTHTANKHP